MTRAGFPGPPSARVGIARLERQRKAIAQNVSVAAESVGSRGFNVLGLVAELHCPCCYEAESRCRRTPPHSV